MDPGFSDGAEPLRKETTSLDLQQVRVEVGVVRRNRSPKLAPIMALPQELLAYTFEIVLFTEYRGRFILDMLNYPTTHMLEPLMHPNILSSVCTYWYQVATNTPSLWAHIDLVISGKYKEIYYARASRFIKKASNTLLFIRIHDDFGPSSLNDVRQLTTWLAPIAGKMYSLSMFIGKTKFLRSVLQCWFEHGTPGTVKELSVLGYGSRIFGDPHWLIEPASASNPSSSQLNVSPERFEEFFRPIVLLRLEGAFVPWHRQAYHGLVYLELDAGHIQEAELINLLSSSPQLRTLSFSIPIVDTSPRNTAVTQVPLPLLEMLSLTGMETDSVWSLLRLVAPGSGPLKLLLENYSPDVENDLPDVEDNFTQIEEVKAFIQRSNITTVHLSGAMDDGDIWFPRILSDFPHLHTLTLNRYSLCNYGAGVADDLFEAVCPSLRELYLVCCDLELDLLKHLLRIHSIQILRIAGCRDLDFDPIQSLEILKNELSTLVPNVKCYEDRKGGYSKFYFNWDFKYI